MSATLKTPNIGQFQAWAKAYADLGHTVVATQVFAEAERKRVDAYIEPLFRTFAFYVSPDMGDTSERITDRKQLYLTDLESPEYKRYLAECDKANRAHGWTGETGYCPALVAETFQMDAERALLESASKMFGVDFTTAHGDMRAKALDLLIGATVKAWHERRAA